MSNKNRIIKKSSKSRQKKVLSKYSINELIDNAQEHINTFNYSDAQTFLQEVLKRDCDNIRALEVTGNLCLDLGNFENAKKCLGRAITVAPENGFSKYMSMGQLLEGKESLQCYLKGIELIEKSLNGLQNGTGSLENIKSSTSSINKEDRMDCNADEKAVTNNSKSNSSSLQRVLSNAFCSVADLYMSDLCDEQEAENESLSAIENAVKVDATNPEAFLHMSNYLLIKEDIEEARRNIIKSVSLWMPNYLEADKGETSSSSFDPLDVCQVPESARCMTARILIEIEEYSLAEDVLETILEENDEDVYTWYLLGWSFYLRGGDDHKMEAKSHLLKAVEVNELNPANDEGVIDHAKELLEELKHVDLPPPETGQSLEELIENMADMDTED